jgi:hypothetical protein
MWGDFLVDAWLIGARGADDPALHDQCWECGKPAYVAVHLQEETDYDPSCRKIDPSCSCRRVLVSVRFAFCRGCAHLRVVGVVNAARQFAMADLAEDETGAAARRDGLTRLRNALPIALHRYLGADKYIVARVRNALNGLLREESSTSESNNRR